MKATVWLRRSDGQEFHVEVGSAAERNLRAAHAEEIPGPGGDLTAASAAPVAVIDAPAPVTAPLAAPKGRKGKS